MQWSEFCMLLGGLMHDTPLGNIISIRSETDKNVIKNYTKDQRRIYNEWHKREAEKLLSNPAAYTNEMEALYASFKRMFSNVQ